MRNATRISLLQRPSLVLFTAMGSNGEQRLFPVLSTPDFHGTLPFYGEALKVRDPELPCLTHHKWAPSAHIVLKPSGWLTHVATTSDTPLGMWSMFAGSDGLLAPGALALFPLTIGVCELGVQKPSILDGDFGYPSPKQKGFCSPPSVWKMRTALMDVEACAILFGADEDSVRADCWGQVYEVVKRATSDAPALLNGYGLQYLADSALKFAQYRPCTQVLTSSDLRTLE